MNNIRLLPVTLISAIRILNTKWHKNRTVVMSNDMLSLSKEYAAVRDAAFSSDDYFFPQKQNKPFSAVTLQTKFRMFFAQSQPDIPEDLLPAVLLMMKKFCVSCMDFELNYYPEIRSLCEKWN